jgi:biopolymer transport protein ExbB
MQDNPYGLEALWAQGDIIIKSVAILLLIMSVVSWFVIVVRSIGLVRLGRISHSMSDFWHAKSFGEGLHMLGKSSPDNPFRHLAEEGQAAADHHHSHQCDLHGKLPMADWLTSCLRGAIDESTERMQRGLAILASVGSTAPFVGLFGTVWGIYHALVKIGVSGQASIDKVAGPVGEALIMTAFGLVVAIPAVLGYNALSRGNKGIIGKLNRFAHQLHAYFLTGAPLARGKSKAVPISAASAPVKTAVQAQPQPALSESR